MLVFNGSFDQLNREKVDQILESLKECTGDSNIKIVKMIEGSIKIFFETSKKVDLERTGNLLDKSGFNVLELRRLNDEEQQLKVGDIDKSVYHWRTFLKPEFLENILNPGANFLHSRVEDLKLNDLFVAPNLKRVRIEKEADERLDKIINAEDALDKKINTPIKTVIYGADNSGKTTMLRWAYDRYYKLGFIPILISGGLLKDISTEKLKDLVQEQFQKQYESVYTGSFDDFDQDRIILLVDDFHRVRFKKAKFKANLIANLEKFAQNIIILGNDLMQFETYTSKAGKTLNILEHFDKFQILEFGPKLRYDLIKKWNTLGLVEQDANELIRLNNETESYIESIIGKNFVPSYPIYLITILQAKEASNFQKPEYSLHGFYYELLINEALNKAVKNKEEISLYYNYITDYCYFLFDEKIRLDALDIESLQLFHDDYCEDYNIQINLRVMLETLISSKLLKLSHDNKYVSITYKYIYYFFTAKYLANNISNDEIKEQIRLLCQRVYRDEYASIVMFLTHLSKDQFIIDRLLENSKNLFSEYKPVMLEDDVSFINEMVKSLPEQVYQPLDIEQVKEEELRDIEELDQQEKEFDPSRDIENYDLYEDISTLDVLSK